MVTAAQARDLGVSRVDLNRLVRDGSLERVEGAARVYRLTGAPPEPDLEGLRAAWLQLGNGQVASARLRRPDAVASHRSAAAALGLGDLLNGTHEFYVPQRRQLRRQDVRLRVRSALADDQWRVVAGLPVCTAERVVADLLAEREDESAVARICQDALRAGLLTWSRLVDLAGTAAAPYGAETGAALAASLAGPERPAEGRE
jgi:hypothetical protein